MPTRAATLPSCGRKAACGLRREAGRDTALYDPFFHPDASALERRYDFIACSGTAERFHHPAEEATMHTIAAMRGWTCECPVKDVALMHKPHP